MTEENQVPETVDEQILSDNPALKDAGVEVGSEIGEEVGPFRVKIGWSVTATEEEIAAAQAFIASMVSELNSEDIPKAVDAILIRRI